VNGIKEGYLETISGSLFLHAPSGEPLMVATALTNIYVDDNSWPSRVFNML